MIIQNNYFPIGSLQKAHGLHGQLILRLEQPNIPLPTRLFIYIHGIYVPYLVEKWKKAPNKAFIRLSHISTRTEALKLRGHQVFIDKKLLPSHITLHQDIIGKLVKDINHGTLGPVKSFYPRKLQPCITVDYNGIELIIPLSDDLIHSTDHNTLTLNLPQDYLTTMIN